MQRRWICQWLTIGLIATAGLLIAACGGSDNSDTDTGGAATSSTSGSDDSSSLATYQELVDGSLADVTQWPEGAPTTPVPVPKDKLLVGIPCGVATSGCAKSIDGLVEAAKTAGWRTKIIDGQNTTTGARAAISQAIALGADAITITGVAPPSIDDLIQKARDSGAVFTTMYSGYKPETEAPIQADIIDPEKLATVIGAKAVLDSEGKGQFALFNTSEFRIVDDRIKSVRKEIETCPDCEVVADEDFTAAGAQKDLPTLTSGVLTKNPDLSGIITGIDGFATLQVPVIQEVGSDVSLYSINGEEANLKLIKDGQQAATTAFPLTWAGWGAFDQILRVMDKQDPGDPHLPVKLLTKDNLPEPISDGWDADGFDYKGEYKKLWGL